MLRFRHLESKCFELHKHKLINDASFLHLTCKGKVKAIQMIQGKASQSTRITGYNRDTAMAAKTAPRSILVQLQIRSTLFAKQRFGSDGRRHPATCSSEAHIV